MGYTNPVHTAQKSTVPRVVPYLGVSCDNPALGGRTHGWDGTGNRELFPTKFGAAVGLSRGDDEYSLQKGLIVKRELLGSGDIVKYYKISKFKD